MYFRALHHYLTAQDKNVINIASTGIAATLLVNGTTAHRKMMLPINMDANGRSKVNSGVLPSLFFPKLPRISSKSNEKLFYENSSR